MEGRGGRCCTSEQVSDRIDTKRNGNAKIKREIDKRYLWAPPRLLEEVCSQAARTALSLDCVRTVLLFDNIRIERDLSGRDGDRHQKPSVPKKWKEKRRTELKNKKKESNKSSISEFINYSSILNTVKLTFRIVVVFVLTLYRSTYVSPHSHLCPSKSPKSRQLMLQYDDKQLEPLQLLLLPLLLLLPVLLLLFLPWAFLHCIAAEGSSMPSSIPQCLGLISLPQ